MATLTHENLKRIGQRSSLPTCPRCGCVGWLRGPVSGSIDHGWKGRIFCSNCSYLATAQEWFQDLEHAKA